MATDEDSGAFVRLAPAGREVPVVVEVPHAGTLIPTDLRDGLSVAPDDVLRDADTFVDALWADAPTTGPVTLIATVSRNVDGIKLSDTEDSNDRSQRFKRHDTCNHEARRPRMSVRRCSKKSTNTKSSRFPGVA